MVDQEYSPQRATRVAAVASMGTLLALGGFFAGGGHASGAAATVTTGSTASAADLGAIPTNAIATTSTSSTTLSTTTTSTTAAPALTLAPCINSYTVHSGDYWLLVAKEAGVPVADLYSLNGAGPGTALFAGASICLPEGATVVPVAPVAPVPIVTTAARKSPTTTAAPVVTAAQTTRTSG
jgi:LysM repeat protein